MIEFPNQDKVTMQTQFAKNSMQYYILTMMDNFGRTVGAVAEQSVVGSGCVCVCEPVCL